MTYGGKEDPIKALQRAIRAEWYLAAQWEGMSDEEIRNTKFVVFSPDNPYMKPGSRHDKLTRIFQNEMNNRTHGYHNPSIRGIGRASVRLAERALDVGGNARTIGAGFNRFAYKALNEKNHNVNKYDLNPTAGSNSQYEAFHGNPPGRSRMVSCPLPEGPLTAIGKAVRIEYEPYGKSRHVGTRFFHDFGDLGEKMIKERPILVSDRKGNIFFVPESPKYPHFSERGILG